MKFAI